MLMNKGLFGEEEKIISAAWVAKKIRSLAKSPSVLSSSRAGSDRLEGKIKFAPDSLMPDLQGGMKARVKNNSRPTLAEISTGDANNPC